MARTTTEGKRVAAEGAAMGGAVAETPTVGAGTVALVSKRIKFLRLLKMHPAEGLKKTRTTTANVNRNRNPKIIGWQVQD